MNEQKTTQPAITVEDLKDRKRLLLAEIDRMHSRVNELNHWITRLAPSDPVAHWTAIITSVEEIPAITPAEEAASKERAIKAHADELAKGNKALGDAITQVEKKNGKPRNSSGNYYGLLPGHDYTQSEIANKKLWGWHLGRKLSLARQFGHIKCASKRQPFIYHAEDLIAWRDSGEPHKKPKVAKVKK